VEWWNNPLTTSTVDVSVRCMRRSEPDLGEEAAVWSTGFLLIQFFKRHSQATSFL
jgi:hypothetical protein